METESTNGEYLGMAGRELSAGIEEHFSIYHLTLFSWSLEPVIGPIGPIGHIQLANGLFFRDNRAGLLAKSGPIRCGICSRSVR